MKKVKLPPLSKVKSYADFFKYITKSIPMQKGLNINVTAVYLNADNEDKLSKHIFGILRKKHRDYTDYGYNRAWEMYHFNYSPNTKKGIPNGYALLDVGNIHTLPDRR